MGNEFIGTLKQLPGVLRGTWGQRSHDALVQAQHGALDTFFGATHLANTAYSGARRWASRLKTPRTPTASELTRVYGSHVPEEYFRAMDAHAMSGIKRDSEEAVKQASRANFLADWESIARDRLSEPFANRGAGDNIARAGGAIAATAPVAWAMRGPTKLLSKARFTPPQAVGRFAAPLNAVSNAATFGMNTIFGLNPLGKFMYGTGVGSNVLGSVRNMHGGAMTDPVKQGYDKAVSYADALANYSVPYQVQTAVIGSSPMRSSYATTAATFAGRNEILNNQKWFNPDLNRIIRSSAEVDPLTVNSYTRGMKALPDPYMQSAASMRSASWWLDRHRTRR